MSQALSLPVHPKHTESLSQAFIPTENDGHDFKYQIVKLPKCMRDFHYAVHIR